MSNHPTFGEIRYPRTSAPGDDIRMKTTSEAENKLSDLAADFLANERWKDYSQDDWKEFF